MRQLAGCPDGDCPKVFDVEDGTGDLVVQGFDLTPAVLAELGQPPAGERAVRIPRAILEEASRALAAAP